MMPSSPFDGLDAGDREVMEARAAALAAEEDDGRRETLTALVVRVGAERYAVAVGEVVEVVSDYRLTPVPCAPGHVRGIISLRGEIVSVTDLATVLGADRPFGIRDPLLVLASGGVKSAVAVEAVEDIVEVAADELRPPLPLLDQAHAEAVTGSFVIQEGPVALLDAAALLTPVGVET